MDELRRRWDGIPAEIMREQELLNMLLPGLRADVTAIENYVFVDGEPLKCPMSVFGGEGDPSVAQQELQAWQRQTSGPFQLRMMSGNHFFIRDQHGTVIDAIQEDLRPTLCGYQGPTCHSVAGSERTNGFV